MEEQKTKTPEINEELTQLQEDLDWLKKEQDELKTTAFDGDRKPALKLEENKITEMVIDFSAPFQKWEDKENETVKKIIPVRVGAVDFVWWLNVKNPVYHQIVELGVLGKNKIKVLQTGSKQNTKYTILEE